MSCTSKPRSFAVTPPAPAFTTPERMRQMIKESEDIWGPVVKAAH